MLILFLFILLLIFFLYDYLFRRNIRKYLYFKEVQFLSKKLNKKLLVIGDPNSGDFFSFIGKLFFNYNCGDICLDIEGCRKCNNSVKSDLYEYLSKQSDNSLVIFVFCSLEYIEDIEKTFKEILRVSGKDYKIVFIQNLYDSFLGFGKYINKKLNSKRKYIIKSIKDNKIDYIKI